MGQHGAMTRTSTPTTTSRSAPAVTTTASNSGRSGAANLDPADPRSGLAAAVAAARLAIEATCNGSSERLAGPTPCSEYTVEDLIEHLVFIARRVAIIGNGGHFTETPDHLAGSDWAAVFAGEADAIHHAWSDPAKLSASYEVPWGQVPGAALMLAYTAEFAAHTWDLARATGTGVEIVDDVLAGAAEAVRFIPADGRDDPAVPFAPVVEAPAGASNLERIVTWVGRSLDWTPPEG